MKIALKRQFLGKIWNKIRPLGKNHKMGRCDVNNLPRVVKFSKNGIFPHTIKHLRVGQFTNNWIQADMMYTCFLIKILSFLHLSFLHIFYPLTFLHIFFCLFDELPYQKIFKPVKISFVYFLVIILQQKVFIWN